jgi:hypothetical protein
MRSPMLRGGVALVLLVVTAVSAAGGVSAQQTPYTVAATEPCVRNLPTALVGLPPAQPPGPALFVYRAMPDRVVPPAVATLHAFEGAKGRWQGITLSFFKTERSARRSAKSLYNRHVILRNVVIATETPAAQWQKAVLACLGGGVPDPMPTPRTPPKATLATFVGYWGGHTRGLRISATGQGSESASAGCCMRAYDLSFQIVHVTGTVTKATATYRVTRFKRYPTFDRPIMHVGQAGELRLRNGIVANHESEDYFCSDPAWDATGACGA